MPGLPLGGVRASPAPKWSSAGSQSLQSWGAGWGRTPCGEGRGREGQGGQQSQEER